MKKIFISYRRNDSALYAKLIHDELARRFDGKNVFYDIEEIDYGDDFAQKIDADVSQCELLIAVIGPQWVVDAQGRRRLHEAKDYVRYEIATALARRIRVIPVLVKGADVPLESDLPDDLKPLVKINALKIGDQSIKQDLTELLRAITGRGLGEWISRERLRRMVPVLAPIVATALFLLAWMRVFDFFNLDTRIEGFTMALGDAIIRPALREEIAIVDLGDNAGIRDKVEMQGMRRNYALLIDALAAGKAKAVAFDIYFNEPSEHDARLVDAVKAARDRGTYVYFGINDTTSRAQALNQSASGLGILCIGTRLGYASVAPIVIGKPPDSVPSLALLAAHPGFKPGNLIDDNDSQRLLLHTPGEGGTSLVGAYPYEPIKEHQKGCPLINENDTVAQLIIQLSPVERLRAPGTLYRYDEVETAARSGSFVQKIVLVGWETRTDMFPVVRGLSPEKRYGIELHADLLNTLLKRVQIRSLDAWNQFLVTLGMAVFGGLLHVWQLPVSRKLVCVLVSIGYFAISVYFYLSHQLLLNVLYPVAALWVAYWSVGRMRARQEHESWDSTEQSLRPS